MFRLVSRCVYIMRSETVNHICRAYVCVSCYSQNKQQLYSFTVLINGILNRAAIRLLRERKLIFKYYVGGFKIQF
jgi:hypothetical protein